MIMQIDANEDKTYVWKYFEEKYLKNCYAITIIVEFEKVKIWAAMRHDKLSKLIVLSERKRQSKLNALKYIADIMNEEMFDFWLKDMKNKRYIMMMKDDASYHKNAASVRRKQLEEDDYIDWGFEIWSVNSSDLNLIENLWHILRSNIRKRKHQSRNKKELIETLMKEWKKIEHECS